MSVYSIDASALIEILSMLGFLIAATLLAEAGGPRVAIEQAGGWTSYGPSGGFVSALTIDPSSPQTLYAGTTAGVFKTSDGAASWTAISAELPAEVHSLAVDPSSGSRVYFSAGDASSSHDYRTEDGGRTWVAMTPIVTQSFLVPSRVTALAVDPQASETLYAGVSVPAVPTHDYSGAAQIFKSIDQGQSWTQIFSTEGSSATQILFDRENPATIYAVLTPKLFESVDSGATWNDVSPVGFGYVASLAQSESETQALFAAMVPGPVLRSGDRGETWEPSREGLPEGLFARTIVAAAPSILYLGTDQGVFRSDAGGSSWHLQSARSPQELAVDPTTPSTLYSTGPPYTVHAFDGVSKSVDSGATWTPVNDGLNALGITALAADPRSPSTVYAGAFRGVLTSLDSGKTWTEGVVGTDDFLNYPTEIAFDPFDAQTLYVASSEGLFESTDGGGHWELISASIAGNYREISSVVASPFVRSRLFAASAFGRVFRSEDGGAHWASIGPAQIDDQNNFNNLLALDSVSDVLYLGTDQGIFRSVNSGATWQQTSIVDDVLALEVHPGIPNTVFASTRTGLFRSTDAGLSWQPVASAPTGPYGPFVSAIAINPVRPSEIFIALSGLLGVYRSTDGGASWLPFNDGLILAPLTAGGVGALSINATGDRLYGAGVGVFSRPIGPPPTRILPR